MPISRKIGVSDSRNMISAGPASCLNVDIRYTQDELTIDVEPGGVDFDVQVNRPVHRYERGKLDIYMQQWPSIDITVDLSV